MRKYLQIWINKTLADIDADAEGIPLQINYAVEDLDNIGKISGARSRRVFKLAATGQNQSIAEFYEDPAVINPNAADLKEAAVEVNGLPVLTGRAQLIRASREGGYYRASAINYEFAFLGNNAAWFADVKPKRLKDYSYDNHLMTSANVTAGWTASYDAGDEYGYGPIKWKNWESANAIKIYEFTPLLFIRTILDKIFQPLGYTVNSDFFDTDFFKRLVLAVPPFADNNDANEYYVLAAHTSSQNESGSSTVTLAIDDDSSGDNTDADNVWDETSHTINYSYRIPRPGLYDITLEVTTSNFAGAGGLPDQGDIYIYKTDSANNVTTLLAQKLIYPNFGTADTYHLLTSHNFGADDVNNEIYVKMYLGPGYDGGGSPLGYTVDIDAIIEVRLTNNLQAGIPVNFSRNIPDDWKVADFLIGLTQAFNLVWETDPRAYTIRVEPKDSYNNIRRTPTNLDEIKDGFFTDNETDRTFTQDLRRPSSVEAISNVEQVYRIAWKTDPNDETVKAEEIGSQIPIYSAEYTLPDNRYKDGVKTIENKFFAKTVHIFDTQIWGESNIVPTIPIIYPLDYASETTADLANYDAEPRLLCFPGVRTGAGDGKIWVDDAGTVTKENLPTLYFVNYNDSDNLDPSLSFADELTVGGITDGLLKRFFLPEMARRRTGKRVTGFFSLDETDILNLTFRDKWLIDGRRYILNKIVGYDPVNAQSTKAVLTLDMVPELEDINAVTNTELNGIIGPIPCDCLESADNLDLTGGSASDTKFKLYDNGVGNDHTLLFDTKQTLSAAEKTSIQNFFTAPTYRTLIVLIENITIPTGILDLTLYLFEDAVSNFQFLESDKVFSFDYDTYLYPTGCISETSFVVNTGQYIRETALPVPYTITAPDVTGVKTFDCS